jgi:hypothetical protein
VWKWVKQADGTLFHEETVSKILVGFLAKLLTVW